MQKQIKKSIKRLSALAVAALFAAGLISCDNDPGDEPRVVGSVNKLGEFVKGRETVYVERSDTAVYRFDITGRGSDIRKIELWQYEGTGVNATEPVKLHTWEFPGEEIGRQFTVSSSTLGDGKSVDRDVQYSVYVEDMEGNYTSCRVQIFVDVLGYSLTSGAIYTGNSAATSRTFLNLELGRLLPVGQTVADPAGIDLGFAWLSDSPAGSPARACLVSFDEYWRTGIYNMFANEKNGWVKFRKAAPMTEEEFGDRAINAAELKEFYETATVTDPPPGSGFDKAGERIAADIAPGDVYAITTRDGRYGLIRILRVDSTSRDNENAQLSILITKKTDRP